MLKKIFRIAILVFVSAVIAGCNAGENQTNIELIQDMMDQISVKAQDWDPDSYDYSTVLQPPEGTVPVGKEPYKYAKDPIAAGKNLENPLNDDMSVDTLRLGKETYEVFCLVCHGREAKGNGLVAPKMAVKPPSLLSKLIRDHPDGRIYHIITAGQGAMGQYASQIHDKKARWAIVNYLRTLQKQGPVTGKYPETK